jgi:serine/threonine protein kinase
MRITSRTGKIFTCVTEYLRDIKPENFLLKNKEDITNIKMIDFGLSKDYSEVKVMQTPSGSVSLLFPNRNVYSHTT